jgi:very-short-patch-repair endonuclease
MEQGSGSTNLTDVVWLRRDALANGYDDRAIARKLRSGEWCRIRHGAYVSRGLWDDLDSTGRHRVVARAVLRTSHESTVLSHVSAAVEHGAPVWGIDLSVVHVTRTDGRARRKEAGVAHHRGVLPSDQVMLMNDVPATVPLRAALETTTIAPVEAALVTVDGLLRQGNTPPSELRVMAEQIRHWPDSLATNVVVRLADPAHESAGESRTAYFLWRQGLPRPIPQFEIVDEHGITVARVDFAWPEHGVFLEFDGRVKYPEDSEELRKVLLAEKKREELICQLTGWVCIRVGWDDLRDPERLARRIRTVLASRKLFTA